MNTKNNIQFVNRRGFHNYVAGFFCEYIHLERPLLQFRRPILPRA